MSEAKIERRFNEIASGVSKQVLLAVCGAYVDNYKALELGYSRRVNLEKIGEGDPIVAGELFRKVDSLIFGPMILFGIGAKERMDYIESRVQMGRQAV